MRSGPYCTSHIIRHVLERIYFRMDTLIQDAYIANHIVEWAHAETIGLSHLRQILVVS